jgi:hypothetical protein
MTNVRVFRKGFFSSLLAGIVPLAFTLIIMVMVIFGLRQTEASNRAEGVRLLEEAIMRVVIHNYAIEGYFPESLDYIVENYGIFIDHTRFVVHYDAFATNLLPDIRVFELIR